MNSRRYGAAGIVLRNSLMIFGGYESPGSGRLQSTEIINGNGEISTGPNMPTALSRHTVATVNASTLIISGDSPILSPSDDSASLFPFLAADVANLASCWSKPP